MAAQPVSLPFTKPLTSVISIPAIAAAVVGGCSITGGRGTLWGTLLGVLKSRLPLPAAPSAR